jgi:transposase
MMTSDMDTLPLLMLSETPQWHITMPVGRGHPRHQQRGWTMGLKRTDEFRQDAVRIALTSGLTRKQVADDLGVGMSTLNKWITAHRDTDVVSKEDLGLAQENDRLQREEREILKKATVFFASQKP